VKPIQNFLLEGPPGSGKTTLIQKLIQRLEGRLGGFFTEEIRESGERTGFRIHTLEGREGVLAHIGFQTGTRVGRYGVDVQAFEDLVIPCLKNAVAGSDLILIDEIGRMELFSERFKGAVTACLESPAPMVASIMQKPHPFADRIRMRPDVRQITVTREEQGFIIQELLDILKGRDGS
jgi:nucleoside-triphosphatase